MNIVRSKLYLKQFRDILFTIAQDKKEAAKGFKSSLNNSINGLVNFPFKYRKSIYYEDETIRDMTFKGYSIIYRVLESQNNIEILEIFNKNLPTVNSDKEI